MSDPPVSVIPGDEAGVYVVVCQDYRIVALTLDQQRDTPSRWALVDTARDYAILYEFETLEMGMRWFVGQTRVAPDAPDLTRLAWVRYW